MSLKDELDKVVASAVGDLGEIRAELTALEHAMPGACIRTAKVRQIMMTLNSRLQGIHVLAAKEVMIGNEAQATRQDRVEEMELWAGSGLEFPCAFVDSKRMLESLRRAGDHTLDEEDKV